jgi:hypothetical protein
MTKLSCLSLCLMKRRALYLTSKVNRHRGRVWASANPNTSVHRHNTCRVAWSDHMGHFEHLLSVSTTWRFVSTDRLNIYKYTRLWAEILSLFCPHVASSSYKYVRHVIAISENNRLLKSREIRVLVGFAASNFADKTNLLVSSTAYSTKLSLKKFMPAHSNKLWRHIPQGL